MVNLEYKRDPDEPLKELPPSKSVDDYDLKYTKKDCSNENKMKTMSAISETDTTFRYSPGEYKDNKTIQNELKQVENRNIVNEIKKCKVQDQTPFQNIQLRKVDTSKSYIEKNTTTTTFNRNSSSPANKDFDYMKAKPITVKPKYAVDPIAELKNMPRKESTGSEDDPPFNFQAMLRKTNIRRDSRDSLKTAFQAARRFSLSKTADTSSHILKNGGLSEEEQIGPKLVSLEISPGLFIEGHEIEL